MGIPFQALSQSLQPQISYHNLISNQQHNILSTQNYYITHTQQDTSEATSDDGFPDPKKVMFQSMMIPGWGQISNKQIWKVPIVYGLLGGLVWYSRDMTLSYHDYRAAYYNLNPDLPDDLRFGPTPAYISEDANLEQVRSLRTNYRNRRDMSYIFIGLAYGLNILDAFIFAHMRSFDVSEDLSIRTRIKPGIAKQPSAILTLSIDFVKR